MDRRRHTNIKVYYQNPYKETAYEGRLIGFVNNNILNALLTKAEKLRRATTVETQDLGNIFKKPEAVGARLAIVIRQIGNETVYGSNRLFITEPIKSITSINTTQSSVTKYNMVNGVSRAKTKIEVAKVIAIGSKETRFVITEYYET